MTGLRQYENVFTEEELVGFEREVDALSKRAQDGELKPATVDIAPLRTKLFLGLGYTYAGGLNSEMVRPAEAVDPIPEFVTKAIEARLVDKGILAAGFVNSCVINDYKPNGALPSNVATLVADVGERCVFRLHRVAQGSLPDLFAPNRFVVALLGRVPQLRREVYFPTHQVRSGCLLRDAKPFCFSQMQQACAAARNAARSGDSDGGLRCGCVCCDTHARADCPVVRAAAAADDITHCVRCVRAA